MKVRDVMTKQVSFCYPDTTLDKAVQSMTQKSCGFLPVVGEGGNVIGVLTDRDIALALGTRNRKASELSVWDIMTPKLFTCTAEDDIHSVLTTMRMSRVRRLPVIDTEGAPIGILSIDDIVLGAKEHSLSKDVSYKDVEDTYKSICGYTKARGAQPRVAA